MKLQKVIISSNTSAFTHQRSAQDNDKSAKRKRNFVKFQTYQTRKNAIKKLKTLLEQNVEIDIIQDAIWSALLAFQYHPFRTLKGLEYHYYIKGNEIFFSRKDKSITRATVNLAIVKAVELDRIVTGPKKLGCFGASYVYPVLLRLGFIQK